MADAALRFLHASDLHLERAPSGLAEVSDTIRIALADAPYSAAERVLSLAVDERVDFVVLAGDICDPTAIGARGLALLTASFERLAQRGIPVFWAFGEAESRASWPANWQLPPNVHRFAGPAWQTETIERDGVVRARISVAGHAPRGLAFDHLQTISDDAPNIVVGYSPEQPVTAALDRFDYVALGGQHLRRTTSAGKATVHSPGTSQGRTPLESGAHGCTIVEIDADKKFRTRFVPTDHVRWLNQSVVADSDVDQTLQSQLSERLQQLSSSNAGVVCLVKWTVAGPAPLLQRLRHDTLASELTEKLRAEYKSEQQSVWTVSVEPAELPIAEELYEQESLLGELLRSFQFYEQHPEQLLDLEPLMADKHAAGLIASAVRLDDVEDRQRSLKEAARLAVDLLTAQESRR